MPLVFEKEIQPLLPKWNDAKNQSEALKKGGAFKPDIVPVIKKYDQAAVDFDNLKKEKAKLQDLLKSLDKKLSGDGGKYDKLIEQRKKVIEEDEKRFDEYSKELEEHMGNPDAEPADVLKTLGGWVDAGNDYVSMTKSLNDQINKLDADLLAATKKARDEYKAKCDAIEAKAKKIQAEGKAAEAQIRSIALTYEKIATKQSDTDTVKAVREFLKEV